MQFVDEARIYVRSGKGGDGSRSYLRAKFVPMGGPDGGDGGRGGSVILRADPNQGSLLQVRFNPHYRAEHGENGMRNQMFGKAGADKIVVVPVGTVVHDEDTGELLADLDQPGATYVAARGGKGGRGNVHFKSSTNQAPQFAESGGPFREKWIRLELKLIADVGLVGFPNAGKSTLVSRLSAARPKIADYPFTTLTPNLGVVKVGEDNSFVLADIPGIIEGAAEGAGLGHQFLRHVERVAALAFVLDVGWEAQRHPVTDYETLERELGQYSKSLLEKPRVIVLAKADLPDTLAAEDEVRALAERVGAPFFVVSAVAGDGLTPLTYGLFELVKAERAARAAESASAEDEAEVADELEPEPEPESTEI